MKLVIGVLLLVGLAPGLRAQSEAQLKEFFEGKLVKVKLDMPATEDGVDVHADRPRPLDFSQYAGRLKRHGTALRAGQSILVTRVKAKERHIEVQLAGGGYGTFWDDQSTDVFVPSATKSQREKNLEKDIKGERDPQRKRAMQEELDALRKEREREDARNEAAVADAEEAKKANVRQRATEGGSRFNVRYDRVLSSQELTPQSVIQALAEYVEFPSETFGTPAGAPDRAAAAPPAPAPPEGLAVLRSGASRQDVEAALGKPESVSERVAGELTVVVCTFQTSWGRVEAQFVEDLLVKFVVVSN
ncbi:MAG: hypothetical protein ACREMM_13135 [Gemmatimonadales bacterium]